MRDPQDTSVGRCRIWAFRGDGTPEILDFPNDGNRQDLADWLEAPENRPRWMRLCHFEPGERVGLVVGTGPHPRCPPSCGPGQPCDACTVDLRDFWIRQIKNGLYKPEIPPDLVRRVQHRISIHLTGVAAGVAQTHALDAPHDDIDYEAGWRRGTTLRATEAAAYLEHIAPAIDPLAFLDTIPEGAAT